jgi:hypothetical protein
MDQRTAGSTEQLKVPASRSARSRKERAHIAAVRDDLMATLNALEAPKLSASKRAELDDDRVFYLNELIGIEHHTRSRNVRAECGAIIDGCGFDRTVYPKVKPTDL